MGEVLFKELLLDTLLICTAPKEVHEVRTCKLCMCILTATTVF